jgi:predicted nuclease of restriction endonuclease-like (RecB) superfamily
VKEGEAREWYLRAALENGWSRNVLVHMISGQLREREGKALTNFQRELPPPESDLAEQILKDPYNFDFLTVTTAAKEREIENGLLSHLRDRWWNRRANRKIVYRDDFQRGLLSFVDWYKGALSADPARQEAFIRKFDSLCV